MTPRPRALPPIDTHATPRAVSATGVSGTTGLLPFGSLPSESLRAR
jgi:hypothetical protein